MSGAHSRQAQFTQGKQCGGQKNNRAAEEKQKLIRHRVVVRNTNEGWGTDGVKETAVYEANAEVWRSVEGGPAVTKEQERRITMC